MIEYVPRGHGGVGLGHAITVDPATGGGDTGTGGMAIEIRDDSTVGV